MSYNGSGFLVNFQIGINDWIDELFVDFTQNEFRLCNLTISGNNNLSTILGYYGGIGLVGLIPLGINAIGGNNVVKC